MEYYPVAVKVRGVYALVVGGGKVAQRKAAGLLKAGAKVTVISPKVTSALNCLAKKTKLKWLKRKVTKNDISKARIEYNCIFIFNFFKEFFGNLPIGFA